MNASPISGQLRRLFLRFERSALLLDGPWRIDLRPRSGRSKGDIIRDLIHAGFAVKEASHARGLLRPRPKRPIVYARWQPRPPRIARQQIIAKAKE